MTDQRDGGTGNKEWWANSVKTRHSTLHINAFDLDRGKVFWETVEEINQEMIFSDEFQ